MGKTYVKALLLISLVLTIAFPMVESLEKSPRGVDKWFKNLSHKKEKVTQLHFYFHDTVVGKTPSTYKVAESNISATSPTSFGIVYVFDNPLTVEPELNSTTIGQAQGFAASASLKNEIALSMSFNLMFTNEKYNGSTLSLLGRSAILDEYRELSVVGGSGLFRLARGIATAHTVQFDPKTTNAIVEYNLIVIHY